MCVHTLIVLKFGIGAEARVGVSLRLRLRLRSREVDAKERGKVRGIGRRPGCEGKGGMVGKGV